MWSLIKLVFFLGLVLSAALVVYDKKVKTIPLVEQVLTFLKGLPALVVSKFTSTPKQ